MPVNREEDLFTSALEIADPEARREWLERACEGDDQLKGRIQRLLAAHDDADPFFEDGATVFTLSSTIGELRSEMSEDIRKGPRAQAPEEAIGQTIDRYRLVEKIGAGGCGVVYLAEQEKPVRRRVALKIIRSGMETKSIISRFEAERQALAMMDHPKIARVFDAGETGSGLPYFVMEYVRGVPFTTYCDDHRLTVEERLNLFIQVCQAIQHAHQNCVVHGDIKPSNILIEEHDGVPVPKTIDFGISRATEARGANRHPDTARAQLIGTPAYMSPEQVELNGMEIDTRSDIFSLGVLLYELLCGRTPIDSALLAKADFEEIQEIFQTHKRVPPSERLASLDAGEQVRIAASRRIGIRELRAQLHGDLDWILLKALQRDRRKRYETANALARDVERYLHIEPVMAHPSNWFYRTGKLVRRNLGAVLAAGAVALVLVVGTATSTWLFLKERDARQRAVVAEQQQARLRLEAESREQLTQAALMVSLERFEEADQLIRDVVLNESTMEGAAVFRAMGEWHALNGRWKEAAERFDVLLRINHLEGADVASLDYLELGPVLLEIPDLGAFERFRHEAITRFSAEQNPFSDRIIKISLLQPANGEILQRIEPLAEANVQAIEAAEASGDFFVVAWRSMSMALFEYRRGNSEAAIRWGERSLTTSNENAPRSATVHSLLALANYRIGREGEAERHLSLADGLLQNRLDPPFERGSPVNGFWFDWAFARVLHREAQLLLPEPV